MNAGLFSTRHLRARGLQRTDIRRAVEGGALTRVRRGWYCVPSAPQEVVTAARVGGRLTCLAALRIHGAWTLDVSGAHVRVADGIAVVHEPAIRIHWTPERVGPGLDSVDEALTTAVACVDFRALVVVADSLVNRGIITPVHLQAALGITPRGRRVLAVHDPRAESGIETLVRLALRRHRVRTRSQVVIPGVGRVDFLIGDRLVIEADGYDWHGGRAEFERDRERDRELVRRGYIVIRASYRQVITNLDEVISSALDVIRRREHLWRAIHRTQLSESGYLIDLSSTR
jgi:very-short-patch-repair endonuclease